jgi:hypothetical protein
MMRNLALLGAALAVAAASGAAEAQNGDASWRSRAIGAPPSQPYASPGLYSSGNECGVDRAEPEWDANHKFLGYACVRRGSRD